MSDDLIRRSDAIKAIDELSNAYNGWSDTYDKAYIIGTLEEVPKADRPQGEWKSVKASIYPYGYDVKCSMPSFKVDGIGDDDPTIHAIAHLQKVGWLQEHDRILTEPQICDTCRYYNDYIPFVNELIGYIFAYPDDDYMTMECLCRKLHKYGLIEKKDGEWTTDFIDRKTEPSNSEKPNNCEPKICDTCRYYNSNIPCGSTPSACKEADKFAEEFVDGLKKLKQTVPTISKMEQVDKDINVRSKDEPQRDCFLCKWLGDVDVCGRCRNRNLFAEADTEPKPKDEPQTEREGE